MKFVQKKTKKKQIIIYWCELKRVKFVSNHMCKWALGCAHQTAYHDNQREISNSSTEHNPSILNVRFYRRTWISMSSRSRINIPNNPIANDQLIHAPPTMRPTRVSTSAIRGTVVQPQAPPRRRANSLSAPRHSLFNSASVVRNESNRSNRFYRRFYGTLFFFTTVPCSAHSYRKGNSRGGEMCRPIR